MKEYNLRALKINTILTTKLPISKEILMLEVHLARFLENEAAHYIKNELLFQYPRALTKIRTPQEPPQAMLRVS